jgi:cell division transport system permease protein
MAKQVHAHGNALRPTGFDELGLRRALSGGLLPFLVAAMAVLASLALGAAFGAATLAYHWRIGPATALTVQIPDPQQTIAGTTQTRLDRALAVLHETPGLARARPLSANELADLLRPWLGGDGGRLSVPLPAVVELHLQGGMTQPPDLAGRLEAAVPGALIDSQGPWLSRLSVLARSLQACALAALALVIGIAVIVVAVATRAGLAARREAIEIVHGLGATDSYIAGRFARRITWLMMLGGLAGAILALPTLAALAWLAAPFTGAEIAVSQAFDLRTALPVSLWGLVPGLPVAASLIGWITAQITVRRWLRQLP